MCAEHLVVITVVNFSCKQKILKETETEKTIGFLVTFLSLVTFQLRGGGGEGRAPGLSVSLCKILEIVIVLILVTFINENKARKILPNIDTVSFVICLFTFKTFLKISSTIFHFYLALHLQ